MKRVCEQALIQIKQAVFAPFSPFWAVSGEIMWFEIVKIGGLSGVICERLTRKGGTHGADFLGALYLSECSEFEAASLT